MKTIAEYLRNLARMLNQAADKMDPPGPEPTGGGGPGGGTPPR